MSGLVRHFLLLLFLCWTAFPQNSSFPAIGISGAYRVGPGDVLEVNVFGVEELSKPVIIDSRGLVTVPLLPSQCAAGLTTFEIEQRLESLYGEEFLRNPQVSVSVREFRSQPISIIGAVEHPGAYQLQGERRLLEVLAMAGGITAGAGDTITIFRNGQAAPEDSEFGDGCGAQVAADLPQARAVPEEIHIAIRSLLAMDIENPVIEPRDVIRISRAGMVYVIGAVDRPGEFPMKDQQPMTVLRAVSLAAGLTRHAAPQRAKIIREAGGTKQEIAAPVNDILRGRQPDALLLAGDILFVPESRAKSALTRGAEAAIQVGTGIAIWRR